MPELRMPSLGADMESGTLVTWRCGPGDRIARGDIVAEVETEKGIIEVEAFEGGLIEELLVPPGTRVPVGAPLARVGDGAAELAEAPTGVEPTPTAPAARPSVAAPPSRLPPVAPAPPPPSSSAPASRPPATAPAPPVAPPAVAPVEASRRRLTRFPPSVRQLARAENVDPFAILARRFQVPPVAPGPPARPRTDGRVRIAPRARKRADELGIDAASLVGTGPDGSVTTDDVERAARGTRPLPSRADEGRRAADERQTAMRRAIAASMERSNREIPHYYVATTIDLSRAMAWVVTTNTARGVETRLVPAVLLLKATALALRQTPELNGTWRDEALHPNERVHLGVAVSLRGGGLIAPAIHDADRLDLDALMKALGDVVARARSGRLRSSELADATCTVTSLGERGVETVMPLVVSPQVAMLGFGKIAEAPVAVEGRAEVRPVVHATLAADHRATDGHRGAALLAAIAALLSRPETL